MFEVNDRSLRTVRVILNVVTWIGVIACIVCGIVLSALGMLAAGLPILFVGPFACWLMWVFGRLYLSHLCDIKLIRNKLYGVGNENLDIFLKDDGDADAAPAPTPSATGNFNRPAAAQAPASSGEEGKPLSMEERTQKLLRLKKLLDAGAITQEEFDREKAKLLNG